MPKRALAFAALLLLSQSIFAQPMQSPGGVRAADFSVMTYNVHGLPWPVVEERSSDLARIGARLAGLRAVGAQPSVVLLQEAFTEDARRIADLSGYRYRVGGPGASAAGPAVSTRDDAMLSSGARWLNGEDLGKFEGSGLMLLSDYPIVSVKRIAYGDVDCAGYDCLANKGALLATVQVPGGGRVQIVTTHLNSRHASGVSNGRSDTAYRRQVAVLDGFIREQTDLRLPLIVSGDFNVGADPLRAAALLSRARSWGPDAVEALRACAARGDVDNPRDAAEAISRARDLQFVYAGRAERLLPVAAQIAFGRGPDGTMLSDHIGWAIHYRWQRAGRA